MTGKVDPTQT